MKHQLKVSEESKDNTDLESKIKNLKKAGLNEKLIANTLDLDINAVKNILNPPKKIEVTKVSREQKYENRKQDDIAKMRILREKGYSVYVIGATIGVPANDVFYYTKDVKPKQNIRDAKRHLTAEDIEKLKELLAIGLRPDQIARFLKCTEICVVSNIKKFNLKY